jgi:hypothetical protein
MKPSHDVQKEMRAFAFAGDRFRLNRCLAPGMICDVPAIRAHSVQNSRVLDLLARDHHVKALTRRIEGAGPVLSFDDVGRNHATTFEGFCAQHDREIFQPIDQRPITRPDTQQLFLLAYRAVARELHAAMEGAIKIQSGYQKRVGLGLDPPGVPSAAGMFAVEQMILAHQTFVYKGELDDAYGASQFDRLSHDTIELEHARPALAVSSFFSIAGIQNAAGEAIRTSLNVVPVNTKTSLVIFTYLREEASLARAGLHTVLASSGPYQRYLVSKLVLNSCENFVVAPDHFDTWSDDKRAAIVAYFTRTLLSNDLSFDDERLYLF